MCYTSLLPFLTFFSDTSTSPAASFNEHQLPPPPRSIMQRTHTHIQNSQFLCYCLCNGWVEWAGPRSAAPHLPPLLWGVIITAASLPRGQTSSTVNKVEANPPVPSSSLLFPDAHRQPITGHASLLPPLALAPPSRKQHFANRDGCTQAKGAAYGQICVKVKSEVLGKNQTYTYTYTWLYRKFYHKILSSTSLQ